jgi:hypothetical protein
LRIRGIYVYIPFAVQLHTRREGERGEMENRQAVAGMVIVGEAVDMIWEAKRLLELLRDDSRLCAGTRLQAQIELRETLNNTLTELTKITDGKVHNQ